MKKIIKCLLFIYLLPCFATTIDVIRHSDDFLSGYGVADTYEQADNLALQNLISQISVQVEAYFEDIYSEEDGKLYEFTQNRIKTYSSTSLRQVESKVDEVSIPGQVRVLRYIARENLAEIFATRKRQILDYTDNALKAESELRIGDALRYYYWALLLLRSHPDNHSLEYCQGRDQPTLITFLPDRIEKILSLIKFQIVHNNFYTEDSRRSILFNVLYQNKPVENLDFRYYTGDSWSPAITVKDGLGFIELYDQYALNTNKIDLKIEYRYFEKRNLHNELREVMEKTDNPTFARSRCEIWLDLALNSDTLNQMPAFAVDIQPVHQNLAISTYEDIIGEVINAIANNDFSNIEPYFTDNGLKNFHHIINYGNAKVITEDMSLFSARVNDQIVVRSLPMLFKFPRNNREFVEKLAFIFDNDNKITAINFTLNDRAIQDIMDHNKAWGTLENKYQIIQFMEYYKTAYCLKNLEFINNIFDENALIIVGNVLKQEEPIENMYKELGSNIQVIRLSKQEYMERLRQVFRSNEYVNIHFDETTVKKVNGNEKIYGIQIAQDYYSTNYADKGYLFLMIDLSNEQKPKIWVRSWQPEKNEDGSIIGLENFSIYD